MAKQRKPLSTKKPPLPVESHAVIEEWLANHTMPKVRPLVEHIDKLIMKEIPSTQFSIKWGSIFYGTRESGWLMQVAPYTVSVNIVFLNGANFDPQPPLGMDDSSRYLKLFNMGDLNKIDVIHFIEQARGFEGWK